MLGPYGICWGTIYILLLAIDERPWTLLKLYLQVWVPEEKNSQLFFTRKKKTFSLFQIVDTVHKSHNFIKSVCLNILTLKGFVKTNHMLSKNVVCFICYLKLFFVLNFF